MGKKRNKKQGVPMPRWESADVKTLRRFYASTSNTMIGWLIGRSARSVATMGCRLGLKKSKARLVEMGRQNVEVRWNEQKRCD